MTINMLALPKYDVGPAADWSPVHNALTSNQQMGQQRDQFNRTNALAQRQVGLLEQRFGLDKAKAERERDTAEARDWAGFHRYVSGLPEDQRQTVWARRFENPRFKDSPAHVRDFNTAGPHLYAAASQYLDEKELAALGLVKEQTNLARANAYKAMQEGGTATDKQSMSGHLMQLPDGSFVFVQGARTGPPNVYPLQSGGQPQGGAGQPPPAAPSARYPNPPGIGGPAGSPPTPSMQPGSQSAPPPPPPGVGSSSPLARPAGPQVASPPFNALGGGMPHQAPPSPQPSNPTAPPPGRAYAPEYPSATGPASGQFSTDGAASPTGPQPLTPFRPRTVEGGLIFNPATGKFEGSAEDARTRGAFAEASGKNAASEVKEYNAAVRLSRDKLPRLAQMEAILKNPAVYQGAGGNLVVRMKQVATALGIEVEGLAPSEAMRAIGNQFALQLRNPAGGEGMPGHLSDQDRNFLVQSVPGISNSREGNALLTRMMIEREKYVMRQNSEAARYINQHRSSVGLEEHLQKWADRNPMLSKETQRMITGITGVQYGVTSGPASGPGAPKQFNGRLNEPTGAAQPGGRPSFASPGIGGAIPSILGGDDYQSLQSGAQYYAPDGSLRRKK